MLTNSGAKEGDVILATKPVGIGVLTAAMKGEILDKETLSFALKLMTTLNKYARDIMVKYNVHACTDITGFGVLEFARMGVLPEGMYRNRAFAESSVHSGDVELAIQDLLYDPQTSGGLAIAVDPADADALLAELKPAVPSAQRWGTVHTYRGGKRIFLV